MKDLAPVIVDIVDSRHVDDRAELQRHIREVFSRVDPVIPPVRALWATVGDEFQVVYHTAREAARATGLVRLLGTGHFDLRFGIGGGPIRTVEEGEIGPIDEGEGWHRARLALEEVERMQRHGHSWLRTWAHVTGEAEVFEQSALRAYLTSRDHIITRMKSKESRIAAAWLLGITQRQIARNEKISQAAVSQSLETSGGAALAHADRTFLGGDT